MSDERKKVSPEQLSMLIMEVEKDPLLLTSKGRQKCDKAEHFERWEQLTKKLNAVGNGAVKVVPKWQQVRTEKISFSGGAWVAQVVSTSHKIDAATSCCGISE